MCIRDRTEWDLEIYSSVDRKQCFSGYIRKRKSNIFLAQANAAARHVSDINQRTGWWRARQVDGQVKDRCSGQQVNYVSGTLGPLEFGFDRERRAWPRDPVERHFDNRRPSRAVSYICPDIARARRFHLRIYMSLRTPGIIVLLHILEPFRCLVAVRVDIE